MRRRQDHTKRPFFIQTSNTSNASNASLVRPHKKWSFINHQQDSGSLQRIVPTTTRGEVLHPFSNTVLTADSAQDWAIAQRKIGKRVPNIWKARVAPKYPSTFKYRGRVAGKYPGRWYGHDLSRAKWSQSWPWSEVKTWWHQWWICGWCGDDNNDDGLRNENEEDCKDDYVERQSNR